MEFLSQRPLYSTDTSTKGFDLSSGKIWIYPENYPLREYQYEIVKSALYHNTLVCLPTGLGKTFIAAVVMYNFWRWYPQGKIVFLAPTKPLVAQQINACHEIMGIPSNETVELTGTTDQKKRQIAWVEHRVIFATPQVFQKDLEKKIVPSDRVKCVVVDEAHKALGKHSYCESIRLLCEQNQYFRVLALSATPGGKLDAVQEVVRNLHITHMELRDDRSPDIIPYINERKLDIVLVGLGAELAGFKDRYITIMDRHVRVLVEYNVLRGFAGNISKGRIFHIQKEWQQKPNKGGNHGKIMKTLMILMTMYHAYELLVRHGLRAFYNFYQNHLDKFWLNDEKELLSLLEEINYYLGPFPDVRPMPDGTVPEIPEDIRFGHNKFQKLKELLLRHFQSFEDKEEETRAIVFVEYRDIVNEVYVLLLQSRPLIRPQKFVGQAGQKQKQQKVALEDFRSNKVNVLISTSVGEEGLDVGEVDLIVCFDISQHSPIRLVQRMGRTGRKRDGHIVVLVTDGKEHQTLKSTMSRRDSLNDKVLQSSGIINALHEESPRMVPADFDPECQKMMMTIVPKIAPVKGKGKMKEPKKSRKRLDANSKTKNSKLAEPSTSSKPGGSQSSLMRFLKKPTEDPQMEVDDDFVTRTVNENPSLSIRTVRNTQSSQQSLKNGNTIKLSEVRLLSSDDAGVEFLTLCTMKKSENEQTYIDKTRTNPYHPAYYTNTDKNNNFFDFKVPDIKILDCLKNITDYILPSTINHNDDDMICEPTDRFNGCNDFYASSQNEVCEEHSKFEALLDESSSDSNVTVFQPKEEKNNDFPMNEQVDWGENIEGLGLEDFLDEWSEGSRTSVKNNEPKDNKPKETSCQSPINILNKPGVFEDILDCSTDENDTDCNQQIINVESKCPKEKIITENPTEMIIDDAFKGAFEDILNCSSESETDDDLRNINVNSKTLEEKSPTKNPIELPIDDYFEGTFEDILNSSSDNEADVNLRNINVNFETIEEKPTTKNPLEMSIDDQFEGNFEDILNSSSDTEIDFDIQNINVKSKTPEEKDTSEKCAEITISNETTGAFEDILNTSSDESETDCSLELEPDKPDASKKIIATKKPIDPVVENRSRGAIEDPNQICTLRMSVDIEIDKSTDLVLNCKQKTISQHLTDQNDRRNSKILLNPRELPTSDFSHNSTISPCNELTISQTIREVERMYSMKNVHNDSNVNNENEGEKADERSTSPVFPDWPRASYTSRLSGNSVRESTKELILSHSKDPVDEIAESEEDIFGTDDLMVDSDFETQINNIEKSAAQNTLNTVDNLKSCDTSAKNTREEYAEGENVLKKISSNVINKRSGSPFDEAVRSKKTSRSYDLDEKVTEDLCLPARTSIRCELELDDCEWDSGETKNVFLPIRELNEHDTVDFADSDWSIRRKNIRNPTPAKESVADTVVLADCNWSIKTATKSSLGKESLPDTVDFSDSLWSTKETKKSTSSSTKQSVLETIDLTDCDWDDEDVKKPTASLVKKSPPDIVNFDDCFESELVKNPTVSSVQTDLLLDDNDWSSDFETISSSVKPSTSFQENTENRDLPESIKNSLNNADRIGNRFSKTVDTTGWISPKKPKLNLSLGKKLTKNICKSLSTKQNCPKPTESKEDSDSENEFAVGRLETTLTKQLDSDFFAKPDPVDTLTRSKPLGMSNPRRIIRGPLTLRRNDLNKLSINGLSSFAAPNKYTQQQGTRKTLSVGTGRQKSASLDLDTRKKKKRHRAERARVRIRSEFIDDEAEVSSDGNHTPGSSGTDDDLQDFVSYTQHADDSVDMQAHYLQTLRSPHRPGAFHIRKPKSPSPGLEIYSQAVPDEPNSYLYDSFCVAEDDDVFEDSETPEEISILEEIEISLKRKKRKRVQSEDTRANPKRRVVAPPTDTSSSEDEFEKLRRQIHDESFILRNKTQ